MANGHGGARPGGGRPRGKKMLKTLQAEQAREHVRQRVIARLDPMLDAQFDNAEGLKHLMMRDPKPGKFERITGDAKQVDKALKTKNAVWIYTKDPNITAFSDLLNRAFGKPTEQIQLSGADGPLVIRWQRPDYDAPKPIEEKIIEIEAHDPDKPQD